MNKGEAGGLGLEPERWARKNSKEDDDLGEMEMVNDARKLSWSSDGDQAGGGQAVADRMLGYGADV